MAEYIDREKVCVTRERNAKYCETCNDRFACRVLNLPTADVIEREEYKQLRSKIDEALEQTYKVREMVLHSNRTYEVNDVLDIIDEISACFERHIGE